GGAMHLKNRIDLLFYDFFAGCENNSRGKMEIMGKMEICVSFMKAKIFSLAEQQSCVCFTAVV
ncbi:hypothetical protein ACJX0J_036648, partial [Zea mays]